MGYDSVGNVTRQQDPEGHVTYLTSDAANRNTVVQDPMAGKTYFHYDANANRTALVDPEGHPTYFGWDAMDRQTNTTDALGNEQTFDYDAVGNPSVSVDGRGRVTYYGYDAADQPVSTLYDDGLTTYFAYDEAANRSSMIDWHGTTTWAYDAIDWPTVRTQPGDLHTYYEFDAMGNRTGLVDPLGNEMEYEYDPADRMLSATANGQRTTYYEFDANGRMIQKILPTASVCYHNYDAAGRLTDLKDVKSDLSPISTFAFTYDADGNITEALKENGSTWYYEYDALHRLTNADWNDSEDARLYGYEYDYDRVGNRTRLLENDVGTYYTYDEANELLTETLPSEYAEHTYDGEGNTVSRAVDAGDTTYYDYDARNNLGAIWTRDGSTPPNYFAYDGDSARIQIADSEGETNYIWDGPSIIGELEENNALRRAYTHGHTPIPGAFSLLEVEDSERSRYAYHLDQVGGVKRLTDASQSVAATYEYSPFGRILESTGSAPNDFTFPATYLGLGDASCLKLSSSRGYCMRTTRFLSRELLGQLRGDSSFAYAENSPTGYVDPRGSAAQYVTIKPGKKYEGVTRDKLERKHCRCVKKLRRLKRGADTVLDDYRKCYDKVLKRHTCPSARQLENCLVSMGYAEEVMGPGVYFPRTGGVRLRKEPGVCGPLLMSAAWAHESLHRGRHEAMVRNPKQLGTFLLDLEKRSAKFHLKYETEAYKAGMAAIKGFLRVLEGPLCSNYGEPQEE